MKKHSLKAASLVKRPHSAPVHSLKLSLVKKVVRRRASAAGNASNSGVDARLSHGMMPVGCSIAVLDWPDL